jgi:hypothetical protein
VIRVLVSVVIAALAGAAALVAGYAARPGFTLEMDRSMPGVLTGFYESERAGQETFAWSRRQVTMQLPGLDRRGAWTCVVRLRGGRADVSTLPEVTFAVDGIVTGRHATTNDFADIKVPLAPKNGTGAIITLTTATFVPGGGDKRELGVFVDRWSCVPDAGFMPLPPARAIRTAAIASAAFAGVLLVMNAPAVVFGAGVAAMSGLQAIPLTKDFGPFSAFAMPIEWVAVALALVLWVTMLASRMKLGRPLSAAARVALFVTAGVLYLKLIDLFLPSKLVIDADFHAHRLEWVMGGRYFFTQPMPSGVVFPYAIGLYVFTAPWTVFTSDYVSLLRIVVTAVEAAGGILLYRLITRCWGDRFVAATATVLYALVPRTFDIVGSANLTNAFGQSAALAAVAAATLWPLSKGHWKTWIGLILVIAFALLCHISTLTLLGAILGVLFVLYLLAARPPLKHEAWMIASALVVATVLAIVVYYGHFGEAFRSAARIRATPAAVSPGTPAPAQVSLSARVIDVARLAVQAVGWPIVLLAIPGLATWWRRGWRDRLSLAVAALAITFTVFSASVVLTHVEPAFYRYALEFVGRVTLATYPAMVIWAAIGAVSTWRQGGLARVGSALMVVAAIIVAGDAWIEWIR